MYRDAVCHPLYREDDTLFCVENTISPPYGEEYVRTKQSAELRQMVADRKSSDTLYL